MTLWCYDLARDKYAVVLVAVVLTAVRKENERMLVEGSIRCFAWRVIMHNLDENLMGVEKHPERSPENCPETTTRRPGWYIRAWSPLDVAWNKPSVVLTVGQ